MSKARVMEIQLSIKGRPLKTYALAEGSITAGRDPEAAIFLDNVGVSRHHARFERTPEGFFVEDLASANGTYLNDKPVRRALLKDRDVIRIGKFSLWVAMRPDRRSGGGEDRKMSPMVFQGTTVLKADEIQQILRAQEKEEASPFLEVVETPKPSAQPATVRGVSKGALVFGIIASFLVGAAAGAAAVWYFLV